MTTKMEIECSYCGQIVATEEAGAMRAAAHPHKDDASRNCPGTTMPGKMGTARPAK